MKYFEYLYGSQYLELFQKGRDGSKGRLNGNLFFSAFILILIFLFIAFMSLVSEDFTKEINSMFHRLFGYSSGKTIGRILALPLVFILYLIVSLSIGSKNNYRKLCQKFMELPDNEKKKANTVILAPFIVAVTLLMILSILSLYR